MKIQNRGGAPKTIIFLIIRKYYWRTDAPAPIGMADRTQKTNICAVLGQHCLLAEGDIGAPIFTSANSSVRLAYFQANRVN
jgi:hypothetical protein